MPDLLSPGSAGFGQFRVDPATGEVRFAPGSNASWPEEATTQTRLWTRWRDAAGREVVGQVSVDVTRASAMDADVSAYLAAVEAADGQPLEAGVRSAVEAFVTGCKADGLWDAITASVILCGARTISGASVALKGRNVTPSGFTAGNYTRTGGFLGGSGRNIGTGYAGTEIGRYNHHFGVYASEGEPTTGTGELIGPSGIQGVSGSFGIGAIGFPGYYLYCSSDGSGLLVEVGQPDPPIGLIMISRSAASEFSSLQINGVNLGSQPHQSEAATASQVSLLTNGSTGRIAYWSMGKPLDAAAYDARVAALISAIGGAIA